MYKLKEKAYVSTIRFKMQITCRLKGRLSGYRR